MLLSLIALTVDKGVVYPVVGTDLELNCETADITGTLTYEWYKGADKDAHDGKTLTISGDKTKDGDYKCIVIVDGDDTKKSAESPVTNVAFNSKYLIIQSLLPK